jgi:type I restriction-modification system DNA methylase subunit
VAGIINFEKSIGNSKKKKDEEDEDEDGGFDKSLSNMYFSDLKP